jgi:hypothetical protein
MSLEQIADKTRTDNNTVPSYLHFMRLHVCVCVLYIHREKESEREINMS